MMTLRALLAFIFVLGTTAPYQNTAHARWGGARPNPTAKYSEGELLFIATYKAYIQRIVQIQAGLIRKKLICLGFKDQINLNLSTVDDLELRKELGVHFSNYENSDECKRLINEELQVLHNAYSDMKVNLALHRSNPNEVHRAIQDQARRGSFSPSSYFDPATGETRQRYAPITLNCDKIVYPLQMGRTNFCLNNLRTILHTHPWHIPKKFSIGPLDSLMPFDKDLPEIADMDPLTWEEVREGVSRFKNKYVHNDFNNAVLEARQSEEEFGEELQADRYSIEDGFGNYFAANSFQAHGLYVFSEYPDDSAPKKYAEVLSLYPVLAFYRPKLEKVKIDCGNLEKPREKLVNICNRYLANEGEDVSFEGDYSSSIGLTGQIRYEGDEGVSFEGNASAYVGTIEQIKEDMGSAFLKVLEINESLLKTLGEELDLSKILDESLNVKPNPNITDFMSWKKLVRFDKALESFIEKNANFEEDSKIFIREIARFDRNIMILGIGGAIAAGVACGIATGLIGAPGMGAVACLASLGINVGFYALSYYEYQKAVEEFFSNPNTSENGLNLSLIEFGTLKMAKQSLAMDTLLIGFDLNAGAIGKSSIALVKKVLKTGDIK